MTVVFIDSDVILDVAFARQPFVRDSATVLAWAEQQLSAYTSSNCIANIYYLLRKQSGDAQARQFLHLLLHYIQVIAINYDDITEALTSSFTDFEDAIQYNCAVRHDCQAIITRNTTDYTQAQIPVYSPKTFLSLRQ